MRRLFVGLIVLWVTPAAWAQSPPTGQRAVPALDSAPGAALHDAEAAYLRGDYATVIRLSKPSLTGTSTETTDELWYLTGMSQLALQRYEKAQHTFERLLDRSPEGHWRLRTETGLARTVWKSGDAARAVMLYQAALEQTNPGTPEALAIQYDLGQAAKTAAQWELSHTTLQGLVMRWPASFESQMAQQTLQNADFGFWVQAGAFGQRENAARLQRELTRRGYAVTVDRTLSEGRAIYRVRLGRFASRAEAVQTAHRLTKTGFPAKVVP